MEGHVLVAMGSTEASEAALEYAFQEYPHAEISVIHVTVASDPLNLFGKRDPCEYVIPEADNEQGEELLPAPDLFTRAQRRRAERVFARAYDLATSYEKEINSVVKSGESVTEIVNYAEKQSVDQIIIAEHPPTELRPILRSVSELVAHRTSTPVTILQ